MAFPFRQQIERDEDKFSEITPICNLKFSSIELISPKEETWELGLPLLPRNMQDGCRRLKWVHCSLELGKEDLMMGVLPLQDLVLEAGEKPDQSFS